MAKDTIAVIGLGYVGLPLAAAFAAKYKVVGFDIDKTRIEQLNRGVDVTGEVEEHALLEVVKNHTDHGIVFSDDADKMRDCNVFIITVPTPVDENNKPDVSLLKRASESVARFLKKGDIVVYESTVYPGYTEEVAVPVLEAASGLRFNEDFFAAYSPERINPGDKQHTITRIMKVTSGSTEATAEKIAELYGSVITAGIYRAPSIKVAEAAKVIENTQRDINVAFMNELAQIFNLLGIDTLEVLKAAGTKWNFLGFRPGLVGGHCIGVDPYYLAEKAMSVGHVPELLLAGRRINDGMGAFIAGRVVTLMAKKQVLAPGAEVLVMGFTFKENIPDVRNTKVIDIVKSLQEANLQTVVYDPVAITDVVHHEYGITCTNDFPEGKKFAAVVVAVAHEGFASVDYSLLLTDPGVLYDVKGILPPGRADERL